MNDEDEKKEITEREAEEFAKAILGGGIDKIEIPVSLPILPVHAMTLYPEMIAPVLVGRDESRKLVDDALLKDKLIGVVGLKNNKDAEPQERDLYSFGTAAKIVRMMKFPDGNYRLFIQGVRRFKITRMEQTKPYFTAKIEKLEDKIEKDIEVEALTRNISNLFQRVASLIPNFPEEMRTAVGNVTNPYSLMYIIAANTNLPTEQKQKLLEDVPLKTKLEMLNVFLNKEVEVLEVGSKIQSHIEDEMGKRSREIYLREQLKAIQDELGESDERTGEIQELSKKIKKAKMPKEVEKEAQNQLKRLSRIQAGSPEYVVARTYLDWLVTIPWTKSTEDNTDIRHAKKILDEDHYDLDDVKDRILEYLAVRRLKDDMHGPILCFVGPPGVGKTSLGMSIARALGRKFWRMSLGGVRDEAEIRGHRRTYIGSLPGRIIQGVRKVESNNPVFMLDEVDKLGIDYRGDPSAALLEVLDPEQNFSFTDHYLEVPFDLSKTMFITTANLLDPIPPPLRDRMEVIELPGYTEEEKIHIAKNHLIPQEYKAHGINSKRVEFTEEGIGVIISDYTREAGVRNLRREVANILRKVARDIAEGKKGKVKVNAKKVEEFLGPAKFFSEVAERLTEPGVATGLVWTPNGGEIIFVETTLMKGGKGLILTGQLGSVLQESAKAALSYIRAHSKELKVPSNFFQTSDIHIHIPAGAIQKDGPSAGITLTISLISLLTGRPVRSDVAMTGEITLRGKVLPVGGIKEKVLAAARAGIKHIILPKHNKKDLHNLPEVVTKKLQFHFAEKISDAVKFAFTGRATKKKRGRST
ncbi:MAG: endopeptidase La, partial [Planctomycetota bacterium]